ncbi:nitrate/nitrite transporter [Ideonella sp. A 288]|uniref:MFS transporter n=1 Tax=Ideonella sp. A 288 TaxID=1962181 RepID=UPI000B4B4143|nr:MFS transporter [Ideonella sp. A 288]
MTRSVDASPRAPAHLLPVIVLAQCAGSSPWFAVNAVMPDLQQAFGWPAQSVGTLTSAVQLGFIAGSLVFAVLALADRHSPRGLFLLCSLAGAACTVGAAWSAGSMPAMLAWRAATGFFLAGIYPVGMKIASLWFPGGLGSALGWLVGALVLGSASPHALRALGMHWPWTQVFLVVAAVAALAGLLLYWWVPEPPHAPARAVGLQFDALASLWRDARVRASVLGYFGHMVELYTMWVLVPAILATRLGGAALSWVAFAVLGAGVAGCVAGGLQVRRFGSARVAAAQLAASGLCCLAAPWALQAPAVVFYGWLLLWGITVVGDSPQYSALTAQNAPRQAVGSVLTLTNSLGFAISIVSIELFVRLSQQVPLASLLPWLALGPLFGLVALAPLWRPAPVRAV